MSAEQLVYAEEKLLECGALDVFKTPIVMKKGRPAVKLSVLTKASMLSAVQRLIVTETTAIGMRYYPVEKLKLERTYETLETPYGAVTLKRAFLDGVCVNEKPEYEDCKRLAKAHNLSLKAVYAAVSRARWTEKGWGDDHS